ncbi:GTP 3',8-cyclase MoaA [Geofilum rubicundum]|uniref:GTP 3',8-cyclase n=1 Tax=Geofilum rubicundum JCM 15548 TaxID=1236989 RepID=A0A0E9M0N6_9BACT|nr:GTP 3',8-cyclase MoaA [Geofilum rubicundum]GAO30705.1 molybdenum cofactor biosynthesis protein MoaA [Geofilum rubicundum JCM 15548]
MLKDQFGRIHNYLRISLTDDCNFRCLYCMPNEKISCLPGSQIMQPHEILKLAETFVNLGVNKIRLTGGEPLVRNGFGQILDELAQLPVELTITTNGFLLKRYLPNLLDAGVKSINVSLDALDPKRFAAVTQRNHFQMVWDNIMLLLQNNIRVKINTVAMAGLIEHELFDFIELTRDLPLHVRFIEFMPFNLNDWKSSKVITADHLLQQTQSRYKIVKLKDEPHATAKKYKIPDHKGTIAFITTMSDHFCEECNRIRLTADGKLKNCIFSSEETDLLTALRKGQAIEPLIHKGLYSKHRALGGQFDQNYKLLNPEALKNRSMISIGG